MLMLGHHILEFPPWRMQWIAIQRSCYPIRKEYMQESRDNYYYILFVE